MLILGIETSCDETAAAVVRDGYDVLSSVIHTQIALHAPYGGVVPEIASRSHIEMVPRVIRKAVADAGVAFGDIDAVAATYGPGLASSLLVGFSAAKGLAVALGKPLIAVNHIHAHVQSAFLPAPAAPRPVGTVLQTAPSRGAGREAPPILALVVSGGHSTLLDIGEDGVPRILGQTLDDAAGEAFDKASKLLGLGYPGGPAIQKAAEAAPPGAARPHFPAGRIEAGNPALAGLDPALCFSFSGLKTSLRSYLQRNPATTPGEIAILAAAYQEAIVGALAARVERALALRRPRALAVGGGVSLNAALRARLAAVAATAGVPLFLPPPKYCGDNAAMVASLAGIGHGVTGDAAMALDVDPGLTFDFAR